MNVTSEKLMSLFGQLLPDIAGKLFPEFPENEQLRLIDGCCDAEHAALRKQCAPLYDGLEETLQALNKKYPLFIVSNCQAGYIEVFLEATGLGHYFKGHLCPGDTGKDKAGNISQIVNDYRLKAPVYVGGYHGGLRSMPKIRCTFYFCLLRLRQCSLPGRSDPQPP